MIVSTTLHFKLSHAAEAGGEAAEALGGEEAPGAEPAAGGETGAAGLLAVPPGSRNAPRVPPGHRDAPRLTPGAKGKLYHPVKVDKRKGTGPRTRSYAAKRSAEKSSATIRNILPGYNDLRSLSRMDGLGAGIYESEQSIYKLREQTEEDKLFEINESIRNLLEGLEKKTTEQDNESETQ